MSIAPKRRRPHLSLGGGALALAATLILAPATASAAAPSVGETWASEVEARSARLSAEINPGGSFTGAYFEYAPAAEFAAKGFAGAKRVNLNNVGGDNAFLTVIFPTIGGLASDTTYLYRLTAINESGITVSPPAPPYHFFHTQPTGGPVLADGRGWEMVSPLDKNGGEVARPGTLAEGGVLQGAAQGGAATYSSAASFAGGRGAPPASQYLATRTAAGWVTQNLTVPIFSGSYDTAAGGSPYRLFSADLARGLLLNGKRCRGEQSEGCPVANPALAGTDAPAGFQDYYLRATESGAFEALVGAADIAGLGLSASDFALTLAGASPELTHVILASCSRLTVSASDGCPAQENLYEWSPGAAPALINSSPGASLAAQSGAVSADGSRVYFYEGGNLWLRDGGALKQADADAGGGGAFQIATADGSLAYFTKAAHLYRYRAGVDAATDLTPSGGVVGVLGAAADGSHLYYLTAAGLHLCASANTAADCEAAAVKVAEDADAGNYPPPSGTARVSADGSKLLFTATAPLTGYDNKDLQTAAPDAQLYLYDAAGVGSLTCISCNPTNGRPLGPSSIPGAIANGSGPTATISYKPRVLTEGGRRVFFDSADALALTDTNNAPDAYEWEAPGEGSCTRAGGCLALISGGRDALGSSFADASADGADAFFITAASLASADLGGADLYDARIGGGFADPPTPIPCAGDACQALPSEPQDPTLTTLLEGPGNPAVHYVRYKHHFKKPKKHHKHAQKPKGKGHASHRRGAGR